MRLLVSADIHLGSPIRSIALRSPELSARLKEASRSTFARIVTTAIEERVDALVLAGDLFDSHYPDLKSRAFLVAQLSRAAEAGVPTVLIRGNHDALLDHDAHGALGPMIHLLDRARPTVEIGGMAFHGLSFETAHVNRSFLPNYPPPVPGKRNIGLMHTSLDGAAGHDPYAPCAASDLLAHGYDLWCLGHIHAPFERQDGAVLAVMPGIPQPRHFGERFGGTVGLVSLGPEGAPPQHRRLPIGQLAFAEAHCDLTACEDQQDVLRALRGALHGAAQPGKDVAVRLRVATQRHGPDMITALSEEVLETRDDVFLDKVLSAPPAQTGHADTDDLLRLMAAEIAEDGFRDAARAVLAELRDAMPPDLSDVLDEGALDALLREALAEVSLSLRSEAGA